MAEIGTPTNAAETTSAPAPGGARSDNEIALELMRFIAVSTGYGKSSQPSTGFSGKPGGKSPEENAEALLELFQQCRRVIKKEA